jgi:hypothetical protein
MAHARLKIVEGYDFIDDGHVYWTLSSTYLVDVFCRTFYHRTK